jgi:hypothetical protein
MPLKFLRQVRILNLADIINYLLGVVFLRIEQQQPNLANWIKSDLTLRCLDFDMFCVLVLGHWVKHFIIVLSLTIINKN